ncbi:MAG: DUF4330 domain-containing protein [Caldisericia bacterium]|nr:DUF4330 domain-containing protein [Caldisericia bacterium]
MVILDDKGKLFGVINIIDLFAIILVVVLLVVSIQFVTNKKTSVQEKDNYIIKVRATNLGPEIAETIKKGLFINYPDGIPFGVVLTNPEVGPTQVYVTTQQGMLISRAQPKLMDASFSFLCSIPKGSNEIKYGNQKFKAGATGFIESNFTKYTVYILSIKPVTTDEAQKIKTTLKDELNPPVQEIEESNDQEDTMKSEDKTP